MNAAINKYGMKITASKVTPAAICQEANQGIETAAVAFDNSSRETETSK